MSTGCSYLICAIQRSGSFLLCEALINTRIGGIPQEYFLFPEGQEFERHPWVKENGAKTRQEYLELILRTGTTPNGVFGCKLMRNQFDIALSGLRELPHLSKLSDHEVFTSVFPNLHYVWMLRKDKLDQAVSWDKAAQTGCYAGTDRSRWRKQPEFSYEAIDGCLKFIQHCEKGWEAFFQKAGVVPLKVYYEDLVDAYQETALLVLRHIGITVPDQIDWGERRMEKQADAINEEWARRYQELKAQER